MTVRRTLAIGFAAVAAWLILASPADPAAGVAVHVAPTHVTRQLGEDVAVRTTTVCPAATTATR